ncbi:MAG: protein DpdH [Streptosporangiaceae bacterium]
MTDFSHFRCWEPAMAAATLTTEAVSPSPAVFVATHAPLRIYRSPVGGRSLDNPGIPVSEDEVQNDFLTRPTANGILLMPVIGQSGTGKSHLVRWIKERTLSTHDRQVIYLPKTHTSLKAVVKALLAEVKDGELDQLKADVDRMSTELDQQGLERRLLSHLHEALAAAESPAAPTRVLAGPNGLALLLLDPHVRNHLLRPGTLIPRLAASLLADRREGDPERPLTFTTEDLPLDILDVKKASDVAQKMLMLIKTRAELQRAAIAMLNEQLPLAITSAGNIGSGRLQSALLKIRREFARQGKEIILLIEDFALIQGIQRDLLDAIIEVGERDGRVVMAPVRTLMAVTTGYYQGLVSTVLTRATAATPYVYDLDVQFDASEEGMAEIVAFVGRYLNAARLGRERLDAEGVRSAKDVPNFCEKCDYRPQCHPAFGFSSEGHGIYPFNETALRRAIRARPAHENPAAFNPRAVIGEVVRNVLVEHGESLVEGTFPNANFRTEYPNVRPEPALSAAVFNSLENLDPLGADRRAKFLEFWGDAPAEPINLSPVLHHAFDIGLLELESYEPPPKPGGKPGPPKPTPPGGLPESVQRMIGFVEDWFSRGRVLDPGPANELRSIIREAIIRRCLWNDPLMPEPNAEVLRVAMPTGSTLVSIEGAAAENRPGTADAPIKFSRGAANSVFFQGLLRAQAGQMPGAAESVRRLSELADRHQDTLRQGVQRARRTTDQDLITGLRASLIGAALAGQACPGMDDAALLTAALDEGRGWARTDRALRIPAWQNTLDRHREARRELVMGLRSGFGISRGVTGSVRMIDAARAVPLLRSAARSWEWRTPDSELAPWVRKAVGRFADWGTLVEAQIALLTQYLDQVRSYLPKGTKLSDTTSAVRVALTAAIETGHAPDGRGQFEQLITNAEAQDWRVVDRLESDLEKANSSGQPADKIIAAVRDRGGGLTVIRDFLTDSETWLTEALQAARMRGGGAGAAALTRVQDLLDQWAEISDRSQG